MDKNIFRNKSIEEISQNKQFNNYIKVASPSVWVIVIASLSLIVGLVIWSFFAVLETKVKVVVVSKDDNVSFFIKEEYMPQLSNKSIIKIKHDDYSFLKPNSLPMMIDEEFDPYTLHLGNLKYGDWVYPVKIASSLPQGIYEAEIIIETSSPIMFIFN